MSFEQEKMIVGSLPSLYPLQKFEEEAINAFVSLQIDDDVISRKATTEAIEKCHEQCCRIDSCGDEWIHYETTLNEVESIPPMPSNTSNALKALNSVNATQSNALDCISRAKAIEALKNDMASLDHIIKDMSANDVRLDAYVSQRNQVSYDIYTINNLPPVQPEQLGTNLAEVGTDCISREQAIDICDHAIDLLKGQFGAGALIAIKESIEELPPAGPQIIRCKQYMIAELDLKQLISAEALKKRFEDIAKSPTNGGLFHIAEILNIIESEQNKMEEVDGLRKERQ